MVVIPVILDIPFIPVNLVNKVTLVILEPTHSSTQYLSYTANPFIKVILVTSVTLVAAERSKGASSNIIRI